MKYFFPSFIVAIFLLGFCDFGFAKISESQKLLQQEEQKLQGIEQNLGFYSAETIPALEKIIELIKAEKMPGAIEFKRRLRLTKEINATPEKPNFDWRTQFAQVLLDLSSVIIVPEEEMLSKEFPLKHYSPDEWSVALLEEALDQLLQSVGVESEAVIQTLVNLASSFEYEGKNLRQAWFYRKLALDIADRTRLSEQLEYIPRTRAHMDELQGKLTAPKWKTEGSRALDGQYFFEKGTQLETKDKLVQATWFYEYALQLFEVAFGFEDVRLIPVISSLVRVYKKQDALELATALEERKISLTQIKEGRGSLEDPETRDAFSVVYLHFAMEIVNPKKDKKPSLPGGHFSIFEWIARLSGRSLYLMEGLSDSGIAAQMVMSHFFSGLASQGLNQLEPALAHFRKALVIAKGETAQEILSIVDEIKPRLAALIERQNEAGMARMHFGNPSAQAAQAQLDEGEKLEKKGDVQAASLQYERALLEFEKAYGFESVRLIPVLEKLEAVSEKRRQTFQVTLFKDRVTLIRRLAEASEEKSAIRIKLAINYLHFSKEIGNLDRELSIGQYAVAALEEHFADINRKNFEEIDFELFKGTYKFLSDCYIIKGQFSEASDVLKKYLALLVEVHQYEEAAKIRDEIKVLCGKNIEGPKP